MYRGLAQAKIVKKGNQALQVRQITSDSFRDDHDLVALPLFVPADANTLADLLDKALAKSCCLDPVPTHLLKQHMDLF